MKHRFLMSAVTASVMGIGIAHADTSDKADGMFTALDANADGQLSASELDNMHSVMAKRRFAKADSDNNGTIDKDEFMAKADERAQHMFKRMDKNGNGAIDEDEIGQRHHRQHGHRGDTSGRKDGNHKRQRHDMMSRMDSNGDDSVSKAEWDSATAKWRAHHDANDDGK